MKKKSTICLLSQNEAHLKIQNMHVNFIWNDLYNQSRDNNWLIDLQTRFIFKSGYTFTIDQHQKYLIPNSCLYGQVSS